MGITFNYTDYEANMTKCIWDITVSEQFLQAISSSGKNSKLENIKPKYPICIFFLYINLKIEPKRLQDVKGANCMSWLKVRD